MIGERERERESKIRTENWNGFSVTYLKDSETDWLLVFQKVISSPSDSWTPLHEKITRKRVERVWKIEDLTLSKIPFILKRTEYTRLWNFDHWFRLLFLRAGTLLRCVEKAYSHGFTFPERLFATAERREHGALRERYFLSEFINGEVLGKWDAGEFFGREQEVLRLVMGSHKFGITWQGDPNPANMMIDKNGKLRGIDLIPGNTYLNKRKDLEYLSRNGCVLPRFYVGVAIVKLEDWLHRKRKL